MKCPRHRGKLYMLHTEDCSVTSMDKMCIIISERLWMDQTGGKQTCQEHFGPVLLSACQTAPTCPLLTEQEQPLIGCHLSSESALGMIRVTAQASNFSLCYTWPDLFQSNTNNIFQPKPQYKASDTKWSQWFHFGFSETSQCAQLQC